MTRRQLAITRTVAAVALVLGLSVAPAARRTAPRERLLDGAVAFALPEGWIVQRSLAREEEGVAAFIPCPALDATPHSANANLLAEGNAEGEGIAAWSARRLAVAAPRRIDEERLEPAWRTLVSTGFDGGARYVVVERFGVSARARLHAVAAFPVVDVAGEGWLARTGDEVDRFLGSIRLAGAPPSQVHVGWDGRTVRLSGPLAGPTVVSRPRNRRRRATRARR